MAMMYIESLEPASFASFEQDMPALGFLETNCYAIAPLLGHTNEYVRRLVSDYYWRAYRVERERASIEGRLASVDWRKCGAFCPPWFNEVLYPLMARSMFDRSQAVQWAAYLYCIRETNEGFMKLAALARDQGTNEWAMQRWRLLYNRGMTNVIPQALFQDVRKASEAKKEALKAKKEAIERMFNEEMERNEKLKKETEEKQRNK
ncbi:MAG: hypothetical protein FJ222_11410 [Lentisphaerae bacterium]|nr:hypothetical protein [Lentisphaerota bacterium]